MPRVVGTPASDHDASACAYAAWAHSSASSRSAGEPARRGQHESPLLAVGVGHDASVRAARSAGREHWPDLDPTERGRDLARHGTRRGASSPSRAWSTSCPIAPDLDAACASRARATHLPRPVIETRSAVGGHAPPTRRMSTPGERSQAVV